MLPNKMIFNKHNSKTKGPTITIDQPFNGAGFLGIFGTAASFGYNLGYLIEDVCNCNIQINPYTLDFTPIEQTLTDFDNAGYNIYGD